MRGALLIGDVPRAYQRVTITYSNPAIPSDHEEVLSFQYYADLNGTFTASPGYVSSHPFSYDQHEGDLNWEIWVGVLPIYKGSVALSVDAITTYFDRNHAYRTGGPKPPRAFLQVNELLSTGSDTTAVASLQYGPYAWTPFSNAPGAQLYFNGVSRTAAQGYSALRAGAADFFVGDSHGNYEHAGQLSTASVEAAPLKTTFFWSSGCAIGDLDFPDNILTSIVYAKGSAVLIGKGTTNDSGGMGNNAQGFYGHNVATALAGGASFGDAILAHVNIPLIAPWSASREFHFGTALVIGDPTLRLRQ